MTSPIAALFLALAASAPAEATSEPPSTSKPLEDQGIIPPVRITGQFFGLWGLDLSQANPDAPNPNGANRFDVTRTYINVESRLARKISLRITPDITRVSGTDGNIDGNLDLRLKYAYVTFEDVLPGVSIRAVQQANPWTNFSNRVWRYRVLGSDILDNFGGVSSADLGVGVLGNHFGGKLDYNVLLSNGEGYTKPEAGQRERAKYKDLASRVTYSPFAGSGSALQGLRLTGYFQYGIKDKIEDRHADRIRALGLLTFENELGTLGIGGGPTWDDEIGEAPGELLRHRGFLFTSWGWVNLPLDLRLIGRFDRFDPGEGWLEGPNETGTRTRLIAGLAYRFTEKVQVIVDWQRFGFEDADEVAPKVAGSTFFVHLEALY